MTESLSVSPKSREEPTPSQKQSRENVESGARFAAETVTETSIRVRPAGASAVLLTEVSFSTNLLGAFMISRSFCDGVSISHVVRGRSRAPPRGVFGRRLMRKSKPGGRSFNFCFAAKVIPPLFRVVSPNQTGVVALTGFSSCNVGAELGVHGRHSGKKEGVILDDRRKPHG